MSVDDEEEAQSQAKDGQRPASIGQKVPEEFKQADGSCQDDEA